MTIQDSTLRVAQLTPAQKGRETPVSGLTDQTCKISSDYKTYLLFFCLNTRNGCCFHDGIGYPVGEVIEVIVDVDNCTEVKYDK